MFDMQDKQVCYIEQKLLSLMPKYNISVDNKQVMTVKQKFRIIGKKFKITSELGEYQVEGNIIAKDFRILKGTTVCASISKKLLSVADTYTVEISDGEDPVLMLAVAIIIDMACHAGK